jgi:glucose-1-phosphate thymidylyltransferase
MKCIILAAGYAIRLHPLTLNKPKPLLEIAGKPMIEHILLRVEEINDIDEIFIVTNDKFYNGFAEWSKSYKSNNKIKIINDNTKSNEERLGAIGDIDFVIKAEKIDDHIIVIGGDNLFEFSLKHLNEFFKQKKASVIALYDVKDKELAKKYGVVELNDDTKIIGFEEKPENPLSTLASTACYIFSKEDIEELEKCIKEHKKPDNLGDFIKYLAIKKHIYGFAFSEKWFDIGSHDELKEADIVWRKK